MNSTTKVALYVRCSTSQQNLDNQRLELKEYCAARKWQATEFSDVISGSTDKRPGLDAMLRDARRRRFEAVVVWSLDRAGRSLPHLIALIDELQSLGIGFISLREGVDLSTAAGRLQLHILGALASFERERLRERVLCGLARARAQGKRLGRQPHDISADRLASVEHLSVREAAKALGVSYSVVSRRRALLRKAARNRNDFRPETGTISLPANQPPTSA